MKGYFARLVARATGGPSAAPNPRGPSSDTNDPFENVAPVEPLLPPRSIPFAGAPPTTVAKREPALPLAPAALQPVAPALPAEPAPTVTRSVEPMEPKASPPLKPELKMESLARETQPPELRETVRTERETEVRRVVNEKLLEPRATAPPTVERIVEKPVTGAVEMLRPEAPRPLEAPPTLPQPMVREAAPRLVPSAPQPATAAPIAADPEPRLVIGRLRVDVLPAAPPPAPQSRTVQVVQRDTASSRGPGAPSRAAFGLGQM